MIKILQYCKLMRIKHWIKNLLILFPLLTAKQLFNARLFFLSAAAFFMFCLLSSCVYVINDIGDLERDRLHPVKKNRPLASGGVRLAQAAAFAALLLLASVLTGLFVFSGNLWVWLTAGGYLALNICYTKWLKNIALIDIFTLAGFYVLRVYFSQAAAGIEISYWLFLTVTMCALFMALGKRRGELAGLKAGETRKVLLEYSGAFLSRAMYGCVSMITVFYALWSRGAMVYTVPLVLYILLRYCLMLEKGADGDPVDSLLSDKALLFACIAYILVFALLLYI